MLIQKIPSGGPDKVFVQSSTCFTEGRMDLPRETNGTNCSSKGVHTRISKETYSHIMTCDIQGGPDTLSAPPSGSAHGKQYASVWQDINQINTRFT